jgi:hypothetical protein
MLALDTVMHEDRINRIAVLITYIKFRGNQEQATHKPTNKAIEDIHVYVRQVVM